ncbi:MAG: helix-turn-helix transcriptional regulator, partial [Nocardioides sp.]
APEEAEQLLRAADLRHRVGSAVLAGRPSEARLWCDAAVAASAAGWDAEARDAGKRAVGALTPDTDPAEAARVLRIWGRLDNLADYGLESAIETDVEAVRLSALSSDVEEQALCLASLSEAETWAGLPDRARDHAVAAVAAAERTGSSLVRAWALASRSAAHWRTEQSLADADEAQALALESGDADTIGHTCVCRANALELLHLFQERAEEYRRGYARAVERGYLRQRQLFAAYGASALIDIAAFGDARQLLREALAVPSTGSGGSAARLNAVLLETYLGDQEAATHHLDRARELVPEIDLREPVVVAKYHLAHGRPEAALRVLLNGFPLVARIEDDNADWLLMLAAMAAGDVATAADTAPSPGASQAQDDLREMVAARTAVDREVFAPVDGIARAHGVVLRAELARAFREPGELEAWRALGEVDEVHGESWTITVALLHWAQALARARAPRTDLAVPLRRAHMRACEFGFAPLRRQVEDLAQRARIGLEGVEPPRGRRAGSVDGPASLTAREREVLGLLVAGRSYAEIGRALFISPKTVSVHVSHVLQKTGTASRAEASAWAWANGLVGPPEPDHLRDHGQVR